MIIAMATLNSVLLYAGTSSDDYKLYMQNKYIYNLIGKRNLLIACFSVLRYFSGS